MKISIAIFLLLCSVTSFGQTKVCADQDTQELFEGHTSTITPDIQNFNGHFQVLINEGDRIALTDQFLAFVLENQKESEEVVIELSDNRILTISASTNVNENGHGPFAEPFIIK